MTISKKQQDKINKEWLYKNGAGEFDFKNTSIKLYEGGLFSIDVKEVMRPKILGTKSLPNGCMEIVCSKKKMIKDTDYSVIIWFTELRETILYLERMERLLKKLGYRTNYKR